MSLTKSCVVGAVALVAVAFSQLAEAAPAVWTVDSSQSFVRLNLPDQNVSYDGITINARVRNQNNATWSDAGGRAATPSGSFVADLQLSGTDPTAVTFLAGQHNLIALDNKALRPTPSQWDPGTETYIDPAATGPAAYGGKLRGFAIIFNLDLAFFSISEVEYDIASAPIPVVGGSFAGGSTFGLSDGVFAVDGLSPSVLGQTIDVPDLLEDVPNFGGANVGVSTITYLGNQTYEMVYNINVPISLDVEVAEGEPPVSITGSAVGVIVATAIIPEPASIGLAAMGALALAGCVIRRRRNA